MLKSLFKKLLMQWDLVYSTHDVAAYSRVMEKLQNKGIPTKTKSINAGGGEGGGYGYSTTYQIFVPKESSHKANEAIHH